MKLYFYIIIIFLFFSGCSTLKNLTDFGSPDVVSTNPSNNQKGVSEDSQIQIIFSEDMNKKSVESNISFTSSKSGNVNYKVNWSSTKKIDLIPDRKMEVGSEYVVYIGEDAKDSAGNKLNIPYILTFIVGEDIVKPEVESIIVQNLVENDPVYTFPHIPIVQMNQMNWRPMITIQFSESMNKMKTIEALKHEGIEGTYNWINSDRILEIIPSKELNTQKYLIMLGKNATDVAGNELKEEKQLEFWIGNDYNNPLIQNCTVFLEGGSSVDLLSGTNIVQNIDGKTEIRVVFSKPMNKESVKNAITISGTIENDALFYQWESTNTILTDNILRLVLHNDKSYGYGEIQTIQISTDAKDLEGNPLLTMLKKLFIVGSLNKPLINKMEVSTISGTENLLAGVTAKNIIKRPQLIIAFDDQLTVPLGMDKASVINAISFSPSIPANNILYSWDNDTLPQILTVQILEDLEFGKEYEVSVSTSARRKDGLVELDKTYKGKFLIGNPADNASYLDVSGNVLFNELPITNNIPIENVMIKIPFNKTLDLDSLKNNILFEPAVEIKNIYAISEGTLSNNVAVIVLDKPLSSITTYQLTIPEGVHAKDDFNAPMGSDYILRFTTAEDLFLINNLKIKDNYSETNYVENASIKYLEDSVFIYPDKKDQITIEIDFNKKFDTETVVSNITVSRANGGESGRPVIADYQGLTADNSSSKLILTIKGIVRDPNDEIFYLLKLMGTDSGNGISSASQVVLNKTYNIIFKTKHRRIYVSTIPTGSDEAQDILSGGTGDESTFNFGEVPATKTKDITFTLMNKGSETLTLTGSPYVIIEGADANHFVVTDGGQPATNTVASDAGTAQFKIQFKPVETEIREYTATVTIYNDDDKGENPYTFTIKATAIPPVPEINVKRNSNNILNGGNFAFTDTITNETTEFTFTIENLGSADLILSEDISISGANPGDFQISEQPVKTISSNEGSNTVLFKIQFKPTTIGEKSAIVQIKSNDADENPYTFTITGIGE